VQHKQVLRKRQPSKSFNDQKTMADEISRQQLVHIRNGIVETFSRVELEVLCFEMGVVLDNLPGVTLEEKAHQLVGFFDRRDELSKLVAALQTARPNYAWKDKRQGRRLPPITPEITPTFQDKTVIEVEVILPDNSRVTGRIDQTRSIADVKESIVEAFDLGDPSGFNLAIVHQNSSTHLNSLKLKTGDVLILVQANKARSKAFTLVSKRSENPVEWRREFREKLDQFFSLDDVRVICFDLSIDYEALEGSSKSVKIQALISHVERNKMIEQLVALCQRTRPTVAW
jgi:Effector-associated domain 7